MTKHEPQRRPREASGLTGSGTPLTQVRTGQEVRFVGVAAGRGLQHRLAEMGLLPGARFVVLSKGQPGPFIIRLGNARLILGAGMATRVLVRPA